MVSRSPSSNGNKQNRRRPKSNGLHRVLRQFLDLEYPTRPAPVSPPSASIFCATGSWTPSPDMPPCQMTTATTTVVVAAVGQDRAGAVQRRRRRSASERGVAGITDAIQEQRRLNVLACIRSPLLVLVLVVVVVRRCHRHRRRRRYGRAANSMRCASKESARGLSATPTHAPILPGEAQSVPRVRPVTAAAAAAAPPPAAAPCVGHRPDLCAATARARGARRVGIPRRHALLGAAERRERRRRRRRRRRDNEPTTRRAAVQSQQPPTYFCLAFSSSSSSTSSSSPFSAAPRRRWLRCLPSGHSARATARVFDSTTGRCSRRAARCHAVLVCGPAKRLPAGARRSFLPRVEFPSAALARRLLRLRRRRRRRIKVRANDWRTRPPLLLLLQRGRGEERTQVGTSSPTPSRKLSNPTLRKALPSCTESLLLFFLLLLQRASIGARRLLGYAGSCWSRTATSRRAMASRCPRGMGITTAQSSSSSLSSSSKIQTKLGGSSAEVIVIPDTPPLGTIDVPRENSGSNGNGIKAKQRAARRWAQDYRRR